MTSSGDKKSVRAARSGLVFPIARSQRVLKHNKKGLRVGERTSIFASSVLQQLVERAFLTLDDGKSRSASGMRVSAKEAFESLRDDVGFSVVTNGVVHCFPKPAPRARKAKKSSA